LTLGAIAWLGLALFWIAMPETGDPAARGTARRGGGCPG
jgi:hypothetical protein